MPIEGDPTSAFLKSKDRDQEFMKVKLEWLQLDRSYKFDLFVKLDGQFLLFCRKDLMLSRAMADKVQKKTIYVEKKERHHFQAYMEGNLASIVRDDTKPLAEKSEAVYAVSTTLVQDLLAEPKAASISGVKNLVGSQMELVLNNPGAINSLMSITQHDYYTYTHSVNVTIYLVGLGERMKLPKDQIYLLTLGGMLHDLGKSRIDGEIINCKGKLSNEQFVEMKKHPDYGIEILRKLDAEGAKIPIECHAAILHHHERFCGGGYPDPSMKGEAIPFFGRVTKICDVFDALTTKRSYKDEMSTFEALRMMRDDMPQEFDPDIFREFLGLMAEYSADMRRKLGM